MGFKDWFKQKLNGGGLKLKKDATRDCFVAAAAQVPGAWVSLSDRMRVAMQVAR